MKIGENSHPYTDPLIMNSRKAIFHVSPPKKVGTFFDLCETQLEAM
jgi:hypothetical protein